MLFVKLPPWEARKFEICVNLGFCLLVEKTTIVLGEQRKKLIERLIPIFYNFICTFPELTFHDFLPAPHQNIYISAKQFRNIISIAL
jgi:hypothetical protein